VVDPWLQQNVRVERPSTRRQVTLDDQVLQQNKYHVFIPEYALCYILLYIFNPCTSGSPYSASFLQVSDHLAIIIEYYCSYCYCGLVSGTLIIQMPD
jgi:hypothetical protein